MTRRPQGARNAWPDGHALPARERQQLCPEIPTAFSPSSAHRPQAGQPWTSFEPGPPREGPRKRALRFTAFCSRRSAYGVRSTATRGGQARCPHARKLMGSTRSQACLISPRNRKGVARAAALAQRNPCSQISRAQGSRQRDLLGQTAVLEPLPSAASEAEASHDADRPTFRVQETRKVDPLTRGNTMRPETTAQSNGCAPVDTPLAARP